MKKSVPVKVAARVFGKDPSWVRAGIIEGWLPIGTATKKGKVVTSISEIRGGERTNYYISPKKLWEVTGYLWLGEKEYDPNTRFPENDSES